MISAGKRGPCVRRGLRELLAQATSGTPGSLDGGDNGSFRGRVAQTELPPQEPYPPAASGGRAIFVPFTPRTRSGAGQADVLRIEKGVA